MSSMKPAWRWLPILILAAGLLPCGIGAAGAAGKVAMVVGNRSYEGVPLKNPLNDAQDMASALKSLGFQVTLVRDAGLKEMEDSVRKFSSVLAGAEVGVFFYAGHGVQADETNYLIPVRADIQSATDFRYKAMDVNFVMDQMEHAGSRLNIIILDACRNNPFRGLRGSRGGLGNMSGPEGSLLAFATSPNKTAEDGEGRNGLYTKHILRHLATPGISIEEMFKRVLVGVSRDTGGRQTPWVNSSLSDNFCFAGCTAPEDSARAREMEKIRQENEKLARELEKLRSEQAAGAKLANDLKAVQTIKEKLENQLRDMNRNEALNADYKAQLEALRKDKLMLEKELRARNTGSQELLDAKMELLDQISRDKAVLEEQLKAQHLAIQERDAKLKELASVQKEKAQLEQEARRASAETRVTAGRIEELERVRMEKERLLESLRDRDERLKDSEERLRKAYADRSAAPAPEPQQIPLIVNP